VDNVPKDTYELDKINQNSSNIECLLAQQHMLLWTEDKYLEISSGQNTKPVSIIYNEYAEELSFPSIYSGQTRTLKTNMKVTLFMMSTSEICHEIEGESLHTHTQTHTHIFNANPGNQGSPLLFVYINNYKYGNNMKLGILSGKFNIAGYQPELNACY
jgi:hypothetical protein